MKKKKNKMYFPPYDMSDTIEFEFQQSTVPHDQRYQPHSIPRDQAGAFYGEFPTGEPDNYSDYEY